MVACAIVADRLASYATAKAVVMPTVSHLRGWRQNNRVENPHQPVRQRERGLRRFKNLRHTARFCSVLSTVCNQFRPCRHALSAPNYRAVMRRRWREWDVVSETTFAAPSGVPGWSLALTMPKSGTFTKSSSSPSRHKPNVGRLDVAVYSRAQPLNPRRYRLPLAPSGKRLSRGWFFIRSRGTLRVPLPPKVFGQLRGRSMEPNRGTALPWSGGVPNSCGPHAPARGELMEADLLLGRERATTADGRT
jgi:hypothetical protein